MCVHMLKTNWKKCICFDDNRKKRKVALVFSNEPVFQIFYLSEEKELRKKRSTWGSVYFCP